MRIRSSDLARKERSSGLAAPHLPPPEAAKPSYDSFWLDDGHGREPVAPEAGQTDPQQAVPGSQFRAFSCRPPKHAAVVAQGEVLEPRAARERKIEDSVVERCKE
ncbi:MAG: hypothetical protein AUH13_24500 [Acidobacteria bacterium 13_2_20CM_58_27]|nr:MAG: hypothetical protein AUH13_24500 [Acidobacteria bacterium 13_2_20CM_58_27]